MSPLAQLALAYSASAGFIAMAVVAGPQEPPIVITGEAHHNHELVRQSVNVADLDLTTAVGQSEAQKRISVAIKKVCPTTAAKMPGYMRQHAADCQKTASAQAKAQLDHEIADAKAKRGMK